MKKRDWLIIGTLMLLALAVRLYKIDAPLADFHSWRQADTAAVARNYARDGINLLRPQYDDLSSVQTGLENPQGLRFVEFPIYNAITALSYRIAPLVPVEVHGRLISILFTMISLIPLYYIALSEKGRKAAIGGTLIYAIAPFFVFFTRVVLPEPTAVACSLYALGFFYLGLIKKHKPASAYILAGAVFFAMAILVKPTTIFYGLAVATMFLIRYTFEIFKRWDLYVSLLIVLVPFVLWRLYITQFPEGIPASSWLITMVNTFEGPKEIFFRPAFFRWMFLERIGILIMGAYGAAFLILATVTRYKRMVIPSILLSGLAYLLVFQGGNVQHEYYQVILFPALALGAGVGFGQLLSLPKSSFYPWLGYPVALGILLLAVFYSGYKVKDYYVISSDLPKTAELLRLYTQPDDKIVTDRMGDTTLLYLADRKGAPAFYKEIDELKRLGYAYLLTADKENAQKLNERGYAIVADTNYFVLLQL